MKKDDHLPLLKETTSLILSHPKKLTITNINVVGFDSWDGGHEYTGFIFVSLNVQNFNILSPGSKFMDYFVVLETDVMKIVLPSVDPIIFFKKWWTVFT